jgi:hypothetical protein
MKAMNNIKVFGSGTDKTIMKCKKSLHLSQQKLKFSIKMPIILTESVKEFDSFLGKGLSD